MSETDQITAAVDAVFDLYRKHGNSDYIGEAVTQTQHAAQCGMLAEKEGFPKEIVLGAFLHDVGHLVGLDQQLERMITNGVALGAKNHEVVGEKYLQDLGFPSVIVDFVRGHVNAKRYLVHKYADYHDKLSEASKMTLVHQGGPMTAEEADAFEKSPTFDAILRMRSWDDQAKDPNLKIEPLEKYRDLCLDFLMQN